MNSASGNQIQQWVQEAVQSTPVTDLHTHLYPPSFGNLNLWGIDELLTYHYLIAESIRAARLPYEEYWAMSQSAQADFIWRTLFVERAPLSEACRGVLTVLNALGLDVNARDLKGFREYFAQQKPQDYLDRIMKLANVRSIVMTNDPFDPAERPVWLKGVDVDPRFRAVLRIDPLLLGWPSVADSLSQMGYKCSPTMDSATMGQVRRFLNEWLDRMKAIYMAVSLTPTWRYPDDSPTTRVLNEAILPIARERNIPFAMMIGVRRAANPQLRMAGDSLGHADISSVERICAQNPDNKFLCTMLSRENQHELAVAARKSPNLMIFGCWWFMNNPSIIEEITRMRMEMLGESFVPQHSDARILDQLLYKWQHSRRIIAKVMNDKFQDLATAGWKVTREQVARTAAAYLSDNFERFVEPTKR